MSSHSDVWSGAHMKMAGDRCWAFGGQAPDNLLCFLFFWKHKGSDTDGWNAPPPKKKLSWQANLCTVKVHKLIHKTPAASHCLDHWQWAQTHHANSNFIFNPPTPATDQYRNINGKIYIFSNRVWWFKPDQTPARVNQGIPELFRYPNKADLNIPAPCWTVGEKSGSEMTQKVIRLPGQMSAFRHGPGTRA